MVRPRPSLPGLAKQYFLNGKEVTRTCRRNPAGLSLRHFMPTAFLTILLVTLVIHLFGVSPLPLTFLLAWYFLDSPGRYRIDVQPVPGISRLAATHRDCHDPPLLRGRRVARTANFRRLFDNSEAVFQKIVCEKPKELRAG